MSSAESCVSSLWVSWLLSWHLCIHCYLIVQQQSWLRYHVIVSWEQARISIHFASSHVRIFLKHMSDRIVHIFVQSCAFQVNNKIIAQSHKSSLSLNDQQLQHHEWIQESWIVKVQSSELSCYHSNKNDHFIIYIWLT